VIEAENACAVSVAGPCTLSPIFNVRFGSKADMEASPRDVRFTPKADIEAQSRDVRFVPKADILHCGKERRYSITSSAAC
jgi:hypothetical protein